MERRTVKTLPAANKNEDVPYNLFNNSLEANDGVTRAITREGRIFNVKKLPPEFRHPSTSYVCEGGREARSQVETARLGLRQDVGYAACSRAAHALR